LRDDLIALIGKPKLEQLCLFVPVAIAEGSELKDFLFLIERSQRGVFRGSNRSRIKLCHECGRLLYSPVGGCYLLRQYWDGDSGSTMIANDLLCSPDFFRNALGPRHFPGLRAMSRAIADTPADGLPADYNEMIAEIRRRGWFTSKDIREEIYRPTVRYKRIDVSNVRNGLKS
jgi:hypothetical protein